MVSDETRRSHGPAKISRRATAGIIFKYLFYLACTVLFCWLLLCVFAKVMCMVDLPLQWIVPLTTICSAVATMLGAWILSRNSEKSGILWGAVLSIGCWCILIICGLVNGSHFSTLTVLKLLALLCSGMIGGILGTFTREHKKKRRPAANR